jgi:hypothetical protein
MDRRQGWYEKCDFLVYYDKGIPMVYIDDVLNKHGQAFLSNFKSVHDSEIMWDKYSIVIKNPDKYSPNPNFDLSGVEQIYICSNAVNVSGIIKYRNKSYNPSIFRGDHENYYMDYCHEQEIDKPFPMFGLVPPYYMPIKRLDVQPPLLVPILNTRVTMPEIPARMKSAYEMIINPTYLSEILLDTAHLKEMLKTAKAEYEQL